MLTTISDVVKQLIDAYEQGKEIDLNKYFQIKYSFNQQTIISCISLQSQM